MYLTQSHSQLEPLPELLLYDQDQVVTSFRSLPYELGSEMLPYSGMSDDEVRSDTLDDKPYPDMLDDDAYSDDAYPDYDWSSDSSGSYLSYESPDTSVEDRSGNSARKIMRIDPADEFELDCMLRDLRQNAGLLASAADTDGSLWDFKDDLLLLSGDSHFAYIKTLKDMWTSSVKVPGEWLDRNPDDPHFTEKLQSVGLGLNLLSRQEMEDITVDGHSTAPDFLCFGTLGYPLRVERGYPVQMTSTMHSWRAFARYETLVSCDEPSALAKYMCPAVSPAHDLSFAILNQPYGSTSHPDFILDNVAAIWDLDLLPGHCKRQFSRDKCLDICLAHPALLTCIDLNVRLDDVRFTSDSKPEFGLASELSSAVRDLALHTQRTLDAMLMASALSKKEGVELRPPEWAVVFGLVCLKDRLLIVAHFTVPSRTIEGSEYRCCSCIVDTLLLHPHRKNSQGTVVRDRCDALLERLRLCNASHVLQKHIYRLSSLWDYLVWPHKIQSVEDKLERCYSQYIPTPSPSEASTNDIYAFVLDDIDDDEFNQYHSSADAVLTGVAPMTSASTVDKVMERDHSVFLGSCIIKGNQHHNIDPDVSRRILEWRAGVAP